MSEDYGPTFFGEVAHEGKCHQSDCAIFDEPDEDMGPFACNCADRDIEPDDDDSADDLADKYNLK